MTMEADSRPHLDAHRTRPASSASVQRSCWRLASSPGVTIGGAGRDGGPWLVVSPANALVAQRERHGQKFQVRVGGALGVLLERGMKIFLSGSCWLHCSRVVGQLQQRGLVMAGATGPPWEGGSSRAGSKAVASGAVHAPRGASCRRLLRSPAAGILEDGEASCEGAD
jgi:hypothetical protein